MRIFFLIRSLECGGAERQLVELALGLKQNGHDITVAVFYSGGPLAEPLLNAGVPVVSLDKRGRWDIAPFFLRLLRVLRKYQPDFLYAFMGIPCILSVFMKIILSDLSVVWGVRASNMDLSRYDWLSRYAYRLECVLSVFADLIIANSHAGREYAIFNGFPREKIVVISNGIDTNKFKPCREDGERLRKEWGVSSKEKLVGLVARLDPMKDHPTFITAAGMLAAQCEDVKFVCVGDGPVEYKGQLIKLTNKAGLAGKIIWSGARSDVSAIYNALDVFTLTSISEGFPNVVGEAMASGVPCVVTDVGDVRGLVGDTGIVVPPGDPIKLTKGMAGMLLKIGLESHETEQRARQRIVECFSTAGLADKTDRALSGLL